MGNLYVTEHNDYLKKYNKLCNSKINNITQLQNEINEAKKLLKDDCRVGNKIQKNLWPQKYIQKYDITNLWRYELQEGYRLIYTITSNGNNIYSMLLDLFNHKEYEKIFKY